jgi:hypothetical protein
MKVPNLKSRLSAEISKGLDRFTISEISDKALDRRGHEQGQVLEELPSSRELLSSYILLEVEFHVVAGFKD